MLGIGLEAGVGLELEDRDRVRFRLGNSLIQARLGTGIVIGLGICMGRLWPRNNLKMLLSHDLLPPDRPWLPVPMHPSINKPINDISALVIQSPQSRHHLGQM